MRSKQELTVQGRQPIIPPFHYSTIPLFHSTVPRSIESRLPESTMAIRRTVDWTSLSYPPHENIAFNSFASQAHLLTHAASPCLTMHSTTLRFYDLPRHYCTIIPMYTFVNFFYTYINIVMQICIGC